MAPWACAAEGRAATVAAAAAAVPVRCAPRALALLSASLLAPGSPVFNSVARCCRSLSAAAAEPGIVEVRAYVIKPEGTGAWLKLTDQYAELRRSLNPGWLGMFTCETGGNLNEVVHLYHYQDLAHRERTRRGMLADKSWTGDYIARARQHVQLQTSSVFIPATACMEAGGAPVDVSLFAPATERRSADGLKPIYELRRYQLTPGYGTMPRVLDALRRGLPEKIAVDASGQLVMYAFSDVGTLNQMLELWRYPSAQACVDARKASRRAQGWRDAIAEVTPVVQTFTTTFLNPTRSSPWQ